MIKISWILTVAVGVIAVAAMWRFAASPEIEPVFAPPASMPTAPAPPAPEPSIAPVMPDWTDEHAAVSDETVHQPGKNDEGVEKVQSGGAPKPPAPAMPGKAKQPRTPRVDPVVLTPEQRTNMEESEKALATFTGLVHEGRDAEAVEEARNYLNHPNPEIRREIVSALDWIGLPAAMELARMVDDPLLDVREAAQSGLWDALDEAENPDLKASLLEIAMKSHDPEIREAAIDELYMLPDYIAFPVVLSAFDDPDEAVRESARDALNFISGEELHSRQHALNWYEFNKRELMELEAE